MSSNTNNCNSSGGHGGHQGNRGGQNSQSTMASPKVMTSNKFKGNCADLDGHIFDCLDYKQADTYVHMHKHIAEYIGAEYKSGGDVRASIIGGTKIAIPLPTHPTFSQGYPMNPTPEDKDKEYMHHEMLSMAVKQEYLLHANLQKAYALVLRQCTELLQSKLKQHADWAMLQHDQDVLSLLKVIKGICYKFEDQKYVPLALDNAKHALFNLQQGSMSCSDYLEWFCNLMDVVTTYKGQLYDPGVLMMVFNNSSFDKRAGFGALTDAEKKQLHEKALELQLVTMFIM